MSMAPVAPPEKRDQTRASRSGLGLVTEGHDEGGEGVAGELEA